MERRAFLQTAAATPLASAPAGRMKLGHQHVSEPAALRVLAALGVTHVCSDLPSRSYDENWSVAALTRLRETVASCGLTLAMVPLPMSSSPIEKAEMPDILLGRSPERDREIDQICRMIENCAKAGIPAVKYNLTVLGVVRTEPTTGRGGASLSTFVYDKAKQEPPLTAAGRLPDDLYWERIDYFLTRTVPVAAASKVRMACHPQDPGMPPGKGYRGVETVLGSIAGLRKFVGMHESPYHGLNFCQGTVSEMLQNPRVEILEAIRWFGSRNKIFNVHFRNIRGRFLNFQETLPDDGDVDLVACLRAYKEVGYDGMLMPDHVPKIEGDPGGRQAFAFSFGYIRALMQALGA
jgi:mannonate dehydratase